MFDLQIFYIICECNNKIQLNCVCFFLSTMRFWPCLFYSGTTCFQEKLVSVLIIPVLPSSLSLYWSSAECVLPFWFPSALMVTASVVSGSGRLLSIGGCSRSCWSFFSYTLRVEAVMHTQTIQRKPSQIYRCRTFIVGNQYSQTQFDCKKLWHSPTIGPEWTPYFISWSFNSSSVKPEMSFTSCRTLSVFLVAFWRLRDYEKENACNYFYFSPFLPTRKITEELLCV